MRGTEGNMYAAIATTRAADVNVRNVRLSMFLALNTVVVPFYLTANLTTLERALITDVVFAVALALTLLIQSSLLWVNYWNKKLAELENLDTDPETTDRVRVRIFSEPTLHTSVDRGISANVLITAATWMVVGVWLLALIHSWLVWYSTF